jgi:hypothetical protein
MAISAYPRVAVTNSKSATNPPNGLSLMLVNPSTGNYEPATSATFAGGGGGGGATATNQVEQIGLAEAGNVLLGTAVANQGNQITEAQSTNTLLSQIQAVLEDASTAALQNTIIAVLKLINGGESGSVWQGSEGGTATGLSVRKIVVNEDCVFSALQDANGNNLLTAYNLTGRTITRGSVIVVFDGSNITQIGLTSGSILRYGA